MEGFLVSTPDDPVAFELNFGPFVTDSLVKSVIRHNKHRIMRHLLDKNEIRDWQVAAPRIATLTTKHILDKYPDSWRSEEQKSFCKIRLQCRKVSLALLCVGNLIPDLRDVLAIIARAVWGTRGYCEMEIVKVKRFRIASPPRSGGDPGK
jgi:hypothetical protein